MSRRWPNSLSKSTRLAKTKPPSGKVLHRLDGRRQAGIVAVRLDLPAGAAMGENVADLADRDDGPRPPLVSVSRIVSAGGGVGEILAVAGALEPVFGRADEGPRDDAADIERVAELPGDAAELVEPLEPERLLMRGDLQDAVDRGVADRLAGPHVLGARTPR